MHIGQRIKQLREAAKLTQDQLGQKFAEGKDDPGLTKQAISAWESGRNQPDAAQVVILCETFNVSADALLGTDRGAPTDLTDVSELVLLYARLPKSNRLRILDVARHEISLIDHRTPTRNQSKLGS